MGNIKAGRLFDPSTEEDLSNVESSLRGAGIALRDQEGHFRNFGDVLDEVAGNWNNYENEQKRAIAVAFSGTRMQEKFLVLMENYNSALALADVAAQSSGTATEKYGAYLGGIEASVNSLKAAFEGLSTTLLPQDFSKGFIDAGTGIVSTIDTIVSAIGTLPAAAGLLGGIMGARGSGIFGPNGNSNEYALYLSNRVDAQTIKLRERPNVISPKRSWKRHTSWGGNTEKTRWLTYAATKAV